MAQRGPKPLLPSPIARGPEAVPAAVRDTGSCASGGSIDIFDAAIDGEHVEEAREICAGCPALALCLRYAIGNESHGVWGGTTPEQRDILRHGDLVHSPEVRRGADDLRIEIRNGRLHEHIASDRGVNVRTLARWIVQDVERTAAA